MKKIYAMGNVTEIDNYQSWSNISSSPYQSSTHGDRYVNNYANKIGAPSYQKFEDAGVMPKGSVLAKDSFIVSTSGKTSVGPMFIMEKMAKGFNASSGDWRYTMITPAGKVAGVTNGGGMDMAFCADCHMSVTPDLDSIMLLPDEFRRKF